MLPCVPEERKGEGHTSLSDSWNAVNLCIIHDRRDQRHLLLLVGWGEEGGGDVKNYWHGRHLTESRTLSVFGTLARRPVTELKLSSVNVPCGAFVEWGPSANDSRRSRYREMEPFVKRYSFCVLSSVRKERGSENYLGCLNLGCGWTFVLGSFFLSLFFSFFLSFSSFLFIQWRADRFDVNAVFESRA